MVYTEMLQEKQPCDKIGNINGKIFIINIVYFLTVLPLSKVHIKSFAFLEAIQLQLQQKCLGGQRGVDS